MGHVVISPYTGTLSIWDFWKNKWRRATLRRSLLNTARALDCITFDLEEIMFIKVKFNYVYRAAFGQYLHPSLEGLLAIRSVCNMDCAKCIFTYLLTVFIAAI